MPARYEALRDRFIREGLAPKQAKTTAAKIYHATRKRSEPTLTAHKGK